MRRNPKQKLSPLQKKRLARVTILCVVLGLTWLMFAPGSGIVSVYSKKKELAALKVETESLAEENIRFQEEIGKMKNDPEHLERVARDQGLLRPNERVYDFSKPKKQNNE